MKVINQRYKTVLRNKGKMEKEIEQLQNLHQTFEKKVKDRIEKLSSAISKEFLRDRELKESEQLFRSTFEHAAIGIAHVGLDGRWIRVNKRFCEIAGWPEEELLQQTFLDTTHPDDHEEDLRLIDSMMNGEAPSIVMEKRYIRKDGTTRWVHATASVLRYPTGEPKYGVAIIEDIHEGKQIESALNLLAEAGKRLNTSLDYKVTMKSIAKLVIPLYADWCVIDILEEDNKIHRVEVAHADPRYKNLAKKISKFAPSLEDKGPIAQSLRDGKVRMVNNIKPTHHRQAAKNEQHLKIIKVMDPHSTIIAPLIARGKTMGAISLICSHPEKQYTQSDVTFAQELAARAALAIDNSRLFSNSQQAVATREEFLSITSHELKTPITAAKALTQILQKELRGQKNQHVSELLSKVDSQLNRTIKLINDLLEISKIQSGKFLLRKEYFDIDELVRETVENCQRLTKTQKIFIKGKAKEEIYADRDRIGQVLTNLFTNAIKYSGDAEKIIVKISKNEKGIIVEVEDFGDGIPKNMQKKIFKRFFQLSVSRRMRTGGLGLGLYISNELIKQHKGVLKVESEEGKGSTFTFCLPFKINSD